MEKLARKARLKQLQKIDEKSENESFVLVKEVKKETTTEETTSVVKEEIVCVFKIFFFNGKLEILNLSSFVYFFFHSVLSSHFLTTLI